MRQLSGAFLAILFVTALSATAIAEPEPSMDGWPEWVQKGMAEEIRKPKLRKIKFPDNVIQAKIPGKPEAPEAIEDGWYIASDIKAGSPLECFILTTSTDIATMANNLAENNIAAVVTNNGGEISNRAIFHVAAGEVAGYPYLALEWVYNVGTESNTQLGFTKVRVANKGEVTYACSHNYLGYRKTFADAFESFVANANVDDPTPEPYYEEIATMNLADIGHGIVYTSLTIDEDGDTREYSADASLMPVDSATLTYNDSVGVTFSTPDGNLINAIVADVENGELTNQLSLQRNESGTWVSSGTLQGKEIETEIDGTLEPASTPALLARTRELFAGNEPSVNMLIWIPSADPTRFLDASIVRDDAETKRQGSMILGPLEVNGQFDEFGNMTTGTMAAGPLTISIDRVWSKGAPVQ